MSQTRRFQSWTELKQAGNEFFKNGQYGEAASIYSQAIKEVEKSGKRCTKSGTNRTLNSFYPQAIRLLNRKKNPEDLSILYSNRAASYLKDGNCWECVKDCTVSLDLVPFGIKPLLRRAAAYEALERYRLAYVDYKTALQIDCNIPAAHDGTSRMTKCLTEVDGLSWREKLPLIPTVPMAVKEKLSLATSQQTKQHNGTRENEKSVPGEDSIKKSQTLKEEGNAQVKKGEYKKAIEKYTQSLKHNSSEITTYTNRALCYLSVKMYKEAVQDCGEALRLDSANIKALYRRAQAHKELKDYKACIEDLNSLLKVEPKNTAGQNLLLEVQKKK